MGNDLPMRKEDDREALSGSNIFAIVPIEVVMDRGLTETQIRVLIALLSFRSKNTNLVWPGRALLAKRCGGLQVSHVSRATTALVDRGWLTKQQRGRRIYYGITIPDIVPVPEGGTPPVPEGGTPPVPEGGTPPVPEGGTRKEVTIEFTIDHTTSVAGKQRPQERIFFNSNATPPVLQNISAMQMQSWRSAFPQLDIDVELDRMEGWLTANPKRRKTDYERFIYGWLTREADKAKPRIFVKQHAISL